jgi:hypothetical protein
MRKNGNNSATTANLGSEAKLCAAAGALRLDTSFGRDPPAIRANVIPFDPAFSRDTSR